MNKGIVTIGSALGAGVLSKGLTGMALANQSSPIKIVASLVLCVGAGYMASQESSSNALQGAYMGVSMAQGLELMKNVAQTPAISSRLEGEGKIASFAKSALGLNAAESGLNGRFDENGNYHLEDGTGKFVTPGGELKALNGAWDYENQALNGFTEYEELNGYEDEEFLGYANEDELNGFDDEPEYLAAGEFEDEY